MVERDVPRGASAKQAEAVTLLVPRRDAGTDSARVAGWVFEEIWRYMIGSRWCPTSLAKLVQITPITMVYG